MSYKAKAQAFLDAHPGMTVDEAIDFLDKEIEKMKT